MEAAKKEGRVVLYGTMQTDIFDLLQKAFHKKTGITIDYWRGSSTKVMDRALSESRAGKSLFDLVMSTEDSMLADVRATGATFRPWVAAVLNLAPDHLDRHGSVERYVEAKARIFANQRPGDHAVLNADDPATAALAARTRARVAWFSRLRPVARGAFVRDGWVVARRDGGDEPVCPLTEIPLRGEHNVENVLAATACALWTGMAPAAIRAAVVAFGGVARRFERVREAAGVVYYNDSKGTNVASTVKALESFGEPVILIAGGKGKGQDFTPLGDAARGRVRHAVLIGVDRGQIRPALRAAGAAVEDADSMEGAVRAAAAAARPGEVVLLSPACASFDMFDHFEHRGDVFKAVVNALVPPAGGGR
jgi:UDP-N-acetylmuramoylalanine--D-glutamate ligase